MVGRVGTVAAAAGLLGVGFLAGGMLAPRVPVQAAPAEEKAEPAGGRVGYVLIPRVVNEAKKARHHAEKINEVRRGYVEKAERLRKDLADKQVQQAGGPDRERELTAIKREMEDLDQEARREVESLQKKLIGDLYRDISVVVGELAKENGLDCVQTYTSSPVTLDPVQINHLLTAPSAPLYVRRDADYTAEVIKRMNKRFEDEGGE